MISSLSFSVEVLSFSSFEVILSTFEVLALVEPSDFHWVSSHEGFMGLEVVDDHVLDVLICVKVRGVQPKVLLKLPFRFVK